MEVKQEHEVGMLNTLSAALSYAKQGFQVFPVHGVMEEMCTCNKISCTSPGKHPILADGHKSATLEYERINRWWGEYFPNANIGLRTGDISGILVIDVDSYKPESALALEQLEIDCSQSLQDLVQFSGGGGLHLLFKYPKHGETIRSKTNWRPGIDIRAQGGYIVVAPSVHISGAPYAWEGDDPPSRHELPDLPEQLLTELKDELPLTDSTAASRQETDIAELETIRAALQHLDPDCNRDNWISVGMALHSTAWGDAAFDLWDTWSKKGKKYKAVEMQGTWSSFKRQLKGKTLGTIYFWAKEAGWIEAVFDTRPFIDDRTTCVSERPSVPNCERDGFAFTYGDLAANPPKAVEELWAGPVMPKGGKLLLAGPPKSGKSMFFLQMAVTAAYGGNFLGVDFKRSMKVFWLQAEIMLPYVMKRLEPMMRGLTGAQLALVRNNLIVTGRAPLALNRKEDWSFVAEHIKKHQPDLICIDPAINFFTGEENANAEVMDFLERVADLGRTLPEPATVMALHHTKKGISTQEPFEAIRGASAFRGWYDTGFVLVPTDQGIELHIECRNGPEPKPCGLKRIDAGFERLELGFIDDTKNEIEPAQAIVRAHEVASIVRAKGVSGMVSGPLRQYIEKHYNIAGTAAKKVIKNTVENGLILRRRQGNIQFYQAANLFDEHSISVVTKDGTENAA